jgi:hypothetical protein
MAGSVWFIDHHPSVLVRRLRYGFGARTSIKPGPAWPGRSDPNGIEKSIARSGLTRALSLWAELCLQPFAPTLEPLPG